MFCSEAGKRKEVDIRQGAPWSRVINEPRSRKRTAAALSCQLTITTLPPPSYPHHQLSDAKLARLPFPTPHGRTVPAVVRTEQSPTTVGRNPPQRDQRWERLTSRSVVVPVSFLLFFFRLLRNNIEPRANIHIHPLIVPAPDRRFRYIVAGPRPHRSCKSIS